MMLHCVVEVDGYAQSSDNFAAFLDAELESESVESSQGDGVEDNSYTERGRIKEETLKSWKT